MGKVIQWRKWNGRYDCAVGLGSDCQTAYQLYRLGLRGPAYPFDWLITPFESLCKLLAHRFDGYLLRENLSLVVGKHVVERKYGVLHLHDFRKDGIDFLGDYEQHYQKYRRRIERFLGLLGSGQRVLFVRREVRGGEAGQLVSVLKTTYPGLDFEVLALDDDRRGVSGVWWDRVAQREPYHWHGIDAEWERVMANFRVG